jgi:hypothetical protein
MVEQVVTGTDGIQVPDALVHEAEQPEAPLAAAEPSAREEALWALIRAMSVGERIKLALKGNKEARGILLRDPNRLIPRLVLQNPRISEEEIHMVAKDRNCDEELLGLITDNREWMKVYAIRLALVENARTPVAKAIRLLQTLDERDLSRLSKSKNVPNVIATQARRCLFQMRERRG